MCNDTFLKLYDVPKAGVVYIILRMIPNPIYRVKKQQES